MSFLQNHIMATVMNQTYGVLEERRATTTTQYAWNGGAAVPAGKYIGEQPGDKHTAQQEDSIVGHNASGRILDSVSRADLLPVRVY
jgi:hypothetical protein